MAFPKVYGQLLQQSFQKEQFKISCTCKLSENLIFLNAMKEKGIKYPVTAYVCAENEKNPETATIININIYDLSKEYDSNIIVNYIFEERFLFDYENNILTNNIPCKSMSFMGVKAYEYEFSQYDLPTKAIVFIINRKAFLLQAGSRHNLEEKFKLLTSSFTITK